MHTQLPYGSTGKNLDLQPASYRVNSITVGGGALAHCSTFIMYYGMPLQQDETLHFLSEPAVERTIDL